MLDLGNLKISISVDGQEKVTAELTKTKKSVDNVGDSSEKAGTKFNAAKLKAAAMAAAVGAIAKVALKVGRKLKELADQTAAYGDEIDKQSQKMQISNEAYQEWSYIAERSGTTITSMAVGMKTFRTQINANSESFEKLGVTLKDTNGKFRDTSDIYQDTMYALADLTDANKKYELAQEMFGKKTAAEILPMLNGGSKAMKELQDRAEELGFVMSDETVKACADYQDAMTDVNKAAEGLKNNLIAAVIPGMAAFASKAADVIGKVSSTVHKYMKEYGATGLVNAAVELVGKFALGLIKAIPKVIESVSQIIENFADAIENGDGDFVQSGIKIVVSLAKGLIQAIPQLIVAVAKLISALLGKVNEIPKSLYNIGKNAINNLLAGFKAAWNSLKSWVSEKASWITNKFNKAKEEGNSHRIGLAEVPYDGYRAILHKGETVLTAAETNKLQNLNAVGSGGNTTINFNGSYNFRSKDEINYFMAEAEKIVRRRLGRA